jgi:two-component system alkaline phosphatase synthesis response regulator PhoP
MSKILIVEDDQDIASVLADDLRIDGYVTEIAGNGEIAVTRALEETWDLILLDVMLPLRDGFEVCRRLRHALVRTPIIMLTAKAQDAEKVLGLEIGADDYVTKPFSPRELRARIKAILRRVHDHESGTYGFDDFEVDLTRGELRRGGTPVELTALEFKILAAFIRRRGRLLSRQQLIDAAWGGNTFVTDRAVDTHIVNLRKKIEPEPQRPRYLVSVRGSGYRFDG